MLAEPNFVFRCDKLEILCPMQVGDKARGRNPKTGARVELAAKRVPSLKPSKELKQSVNTDSTEGQPDPMSAHQ
jgi:hypothetical protein